MRCTTRPGRSHERKPPPDVITPDHIRRIIGHHVARAGSLRKLGEEWGISFTHIGNALTGLRTPGPSILARLGLKKVTTITYRRPPRRARNS